MSKKRKFNQSVYFQDSSGEEYFLLQVVNYGKKDDELKFTFVNPEIQRIVRLRNDDQISVHHHGEITYHADGSILQKIARNKRYNEENIYNNPHGRGVRRTPISELRDWESFAQYTVVDYRFCKKFNPSTKLVLPFWPHVFNGNPFSCIVYLGHFMTPSLIINSRYGFTYRIHQVANDVDLLLAVVKSDYKGRVIKIPGTEIEVFNRSNFVEMIERRKSSFPPR